MKASFLIAAPMSGSGKTTIARGLMALLTRQGLRVQPFKCGPDYIDTKFHEAVCHRPSINLDTFMSTEAHIRDLFRRYTEGGETAPEGAREPADVAVVEGMMGLFDGYDHDRGSATEIARVLDLPVVLVVDARSAAWSTAALLQGFIHFQPELRFAGVIFNKVGSARHADMLREAAADVGIPCLGCIPKQPALEQGSRYLGLDFSVNAEVEQLVQTLEENVVWKELVAAAEVDDGNTGADAQPHTSGRTASNDPSFEAVRPDVKPCATLRTLVARNTESFSFIYAETLDLLSQCGTVSFFNPETGEGADALQAMIDLCKQENSSNEPTSAPTADPITVQDSSSKDSPDHAEQKVLPLLYIPGGYPEKHAEALANAKDIRHLIHAYAKAGGRIIAECGGMMYLCDTIVTDEGAFPMCGVLPYSISARQADRRLSLGYRQFTLDDHMFRGHEFHYTRFADPQPASDVQVLNAKGEPVPTAVLRQGNVIASYTHLSPSNIVQAVKLLENNAQE
ncbi:MAG: cobyrinate a,c-diamide synthase [Bacteroidales bacterium]|nr:cobyrinate a,c-diamide synthase [Bacteroidales bacterium]